jgi:hypothetical protein
MISLYTGYRGNWLIMALLAVIVSGVSVASSSALLIIYKFVRLEKVKQEYNQIISAYYRFVYSQEP